MASSTRRTESEDEANPPTNDTTSAVCTAHTQVDRYVHIHHIRPISLSRVLFFFLSLKRIRRQTWDHQRKREDVPVAGQLHTEKESERGREFVPCIDIPPAVYLRLQTPAPHACMPVTSTWTPLVCLDGFFLRKRNPKKPKEAKQDRSISNWRGHANAPHIVILERRRKEKERRVPSHENPSFLFRRKQTRRVGRENSFLKVKRTGDA